MFLSTPALPDAAAETAQERRARQLAMLRRLGEIGMALAELAAREAEREAETESAARRPDPAERPRRNPMVTFARLASGVRQAIVMERQIALGLPVPDRRVPAAPAAPGAPVAPAALISAVTADAAIAGIASLLEAQIGRLSGMAERGSLPGSTAGARPAGTGLAAAAAPRRPP